VLNKRRFSIFFQISVVEKEKVVLLQPQKLTISINNLKEGSVLK